MAESTTGIWSVFSNPAFYEWFQSVTGARRDQKKIIADYVKPFPNCRVLDIGCGTGETASNLPQAYYVGFDHSERYIQAGTKLGRPNARLICDDVSRFESYEKDKFDIVLGFGVLHHLDDRSCDSLFALGKSALKPGGRIITVDPVYHDHQSFSDKLLTGLDRGHHVRHEREYFALARSHFERIETHILPGNLPVPRSGFIMIARN